MLCDALLIREYFLGEHPKVAAGIFAIYVLEALTHIEFDWLNNGRCKFILLDILQLRVVAEYILYMREWCVRRNQKWGNDEFRPNLGYESLYGSIPSLALQVP